MRSNRRKTPRLPWSSAWMPRVLTMLSFLTIWPPKCYLRSVRSEALTQTSQLTTNARITNGMTRCHGPVGMTRMKMTNVTSAMTFRPLPNDDGPRLNLRGLTSRLVMSTDMRATIVLMRIQIGRKNHRKPMMDQPRIWRTADIVLECEDGTVYFRPVKYDNGEANSKASDGPEPKTAL